MRYLIRCLSRFVAVFCTLAALVPLLAAGFTVASRWLWTQQWYRVDSSDGDYPFVPQYETWLFIVHWIVISARLGLIVVAIVAIIAAVVPLQQLWAQWCAIIVGQLASLPFGRISTATSNENWRLHFVSFLFMVIASVCFFAALRLLLRVDRRWWHLWDMPAPAERAEVG